MNIFTKPRLGTVSYTISLVDTLAGGETITSISSAQVTPTTSPALTATAAVGVPATTFTVTVGAGAEDVTYGVKFDVTTNLRTFTQSMAVLVRTDLNVPYQTQTPFTYQSLTDSIEAGESALGKCYFILPAGPANTDSSEVVWQLLDRNGVVFASGNAFEYKVENKSFATVLEALAVVHVPSEVPPSIDTERYQIRWELRLDSNSQPMYQFESLKVTGKTTVPLGPQDAIELVGDAAGISIVLQQAYQNVGFEVYSKNTKVIDFLRTPATDRVGSGWFYGSTIETTSLTPSLDPYTVTWKYWNLPTQVNREASKLFVLTPSIMQAIEDVRRYINKASTTLFGFEDMIFTASDIVTFLRRARDSFNGASGILTSFDMTNASGAVREYWLRYAEVALLQQQYLAEGEKAFQFQGQAISLDVDRTQYYQSLASDLQGRLDNDIKPFKQNLMKKGLAGGDGNMDGMGTGIGSVGALGINLTPATNFSYLGLRNRL
jgi:hypothetical protein